MESSSSDHVMTAVTPPYDEIEYPSGSVPLRPSISLEATEQSTPSLMPSTPLGDGTITRDTYVFVHDPVMNSGHVLPRIPPPIHELDATWNDLVAKLAAMATAAPPLPPKLDWIASCPKGYSNRYARSLHFWTTAAERFNDCAQPRGLGRGAQGAIPEVHGDKERARRSHRERGVGV